MSFKALLTMMRPHQWLKNLMLFFPPFLGGQLFQIQKLDSLLAFSSFSLAASGIYIFNDLCDRKLDTHHPVKKFRPLADGLAKPLPVIFLSSGLFIISIIFGISISLLFLVPLLSYIFISLAYSYFLKNIPLVEMFCVVSGFIFRLFAGGIAFAVVVSDWLFLCVFLLALFLICGKRLSELRHEGGLSPELVRPVLSKYPKGFLDAGMYISGASVLVTYTMYVLSKPFLVFTVPLCCFGLLAYILRVLSGKGGDPTRALLLDPVLCLVGLTWAFLVGWTIYGL